MKIVEPSAALMRGGYESPSEFYTPEQFIELVGRNCYKSEGKTTQGSAVDFVHKLIDRKHEAMIEHWSLIFEVKRDYFYRSVFNAWTYAFECWEFNPDDGFVPKIRFTKDEDRNHYVISGNIRSWRDFIRLHQRKGGFVPFFLDEVALAAPAFFDDLLKIERHIPEEDRWLKQITVNDLISDFEHLVHHDMTIRFICNRGVTHEMVRHREASYAQESTRYCNYSKGQFGEEITVVRPGWCEEGGSRYEVWRRGCQADEDRYMTLLDMGVSPQDARDVLNHSLKADIIVTGNMAHWLHFESLRCSPAAHPRMREVAIMARGIRKSVWCPAVENK